MDILCQLIFSLQTIVCVRNAPSGELNNASLNIAFRVCFIDLTPSLLLAAILDISLKVSSDISTLSP